MKNLLKPGLFILLLVLIGVTGWYAWDTKTKADATLDQANTSDSARPADEQTNESADSKATVVTSGYTGNAAIEQAQLSQIPNLQPAVATHNRSAAPACIGTDGQLRNEAGQASDSTVNYITGAAAKVQACGGVQVYAVMQGEQWMFVAGGQGAYKCADLQKYDVPAKLIADANSGLASCVTVSGQTATYKD